MISFSFSRTTGLLFVVGLLFAGIGILLKPANVNAVSVYDDAYVITDDFTITNPSNACTPVDISGSYLSLIGTPENWRSLPEPDRLDRALSTLNYIGDDTVSRAFSTVRGASNNKQDVYFFFSDVQGEITFNSPNQYYRHVNAVSISAILVIISLNNDCDVQVSGTNPDNAGPVSMIISQWQSTPVEYIENIFAQNFTITYPSGYEGEEIRETPPSAPETNFGMGMTPDFRYEVNDYNVTLTDITNPQSIEEFEISLCMFQVPNNTYGDNFTEYAYDCDLKTPVLHTFSQYASYNVLHRMYSEQNDLWYETSQVIKIDGSTYAGTAGLDQSGNSIPDILKRLTVPTFGLQSALVAPIEFVRTIPELAGVCEPISLPLPYIDGDLDLPCMTPIYQSHFNAFLLLWQVSLTALVSYATVNKVFAKLRQTYNPKQDRIEPTNL